jgi:DNA-binding transcriptional MerR regulator
MLDVYVNVNQANPMPPTVGKAQDEVLSVSREAWTIGDLAAELEVTPRTLRFYESEGLIDPIRGPGGSRTYTRRDRTRMQLILRGKRFGMSLPEIAEILSMYDGAESSRIRQLERVVARVEEISVELTARQRDIARTLDELAEVSEQCQGKLEQLRAKT